jgi:hypothetical protein
MTKAQMKLSQAKDIARKSLGLAIVKNRDKIIALLKKYGVAVDDTYSNDELIVGVLAAVQSKARFREDLTKLLTETTGEALSFTGEEQMEFFYMANGEDPWASIKAAYAANNPGQAITSGSVANLSDTTTTTKQKTAIGSLLSDKNTLSNILGTGLNVLSTSLTNKSNQKLADTALAIEAEKTKQAALLAAGGSAAPGTASGWSTGAKIAVGVGAVAFVSLIVWLIVKPKAKKG